MSKKATGAKHLLKSKTRDAERVTNTPAKTEPTRRVHLSYAGQVNSGQFIYTATETAERMGLTGWISRAYHGIADLVVQGPASKVSTYEKTMNESDSTGVLFSLADVEELKPISDEQGFSMNDDGGF